MIYGITSLISLEDEDDSIAITDYEKAGVLNNFLAVPLHMSIQTQFLLSW